MRNHAVKQGVTGKIRVQMRRVHIAGNGCESRNILCLQGADQTGHVAGADFIEAAVFQQRAGHGKPVRICLNRGTLWAGLGGSWGRTVAHGKTLFQWGSGDHLACLLY